IRVYNTRHEQATSYMADGYARVTGRVGACLVVPGPGLMNALAGLSTAYATNSPVLCIAGQIDSQQIGAGRGMLHEIPDQLTMVRSATKWAGRAMSPQEVPALVRDAFTQLQTGRPRPVEIEIPPNVLQATANVELLDPVAPDRPAGDPDLIERAAQALGQAQQPLIMAGGGVAGANASATLHELAELLQAPVVVSMGGKGAIDDRSYLAQSMVTGKELMPSADVILVVGTRFSFPPMAPWGPKPHQTVIQLDVDPEEIGRNYPPQIGIVADANLGLRALVERVPRHNRARTSREQELEELRSRVVDRLFEVQPQASFAGVIRDEMPEDGVVIGGMTQVGYWSVAGFPVYGPRTYVSAGYQGTLGFEYATALGAQVGVPHTRVIAVCGDGGFMYNVQELSTAVAHGINAIAIVFNDGAFGNVRRIQKQQFGGRTIGSDLVNPDFVQLAESFGVDGRRAEGPEALRHQLREALAVDRPALIEVPVGEMPDPWNMLFG
ncbi:MAG TPA: thiamine pyrophosphate-dependent enzyme, partial [Thermomicrobiales bacterium]|nr:thiamine pyrophosphate-dependent enzyme [Thermomicrobiales bacterium]